jgi:hypothetical protein
VTDDHTDLPKGGTVEVVTGRADRAAPTPAVQSCAGTRSLDLPPGSYVRATVRDADGRLVGFGNPLWVLPAEPPSGVPAARRVEL